ncbi:MAG: CinA family protein [Alphaproteobacteria bacterium]|nr:CinA family protein [Alphaproteobacteria bacterium]
MDTNLIDQDLTGLVETLTALLLAKRKTMACAESCTGGLIAALMTARPGASDVFERGFVTYSNEAKSELLGVPLGLISRVGAVSDECAERMAQGALQHSHSDVAVSVTGVAGPDGGTADKPVGLVYIGVAGWGYDPVTYKHDFSGDRTDVRTKSCAAALTALIALLEG